MCAQDKKKQKRKQKQNIVKWHGRRSKRRTESERERGAWMLDWTDGKLDCTLRLIEWNTMPSVFNFVFFSFRFSLSFLSFLIASFPSLNRNSIVPAIDDTEQVWYSESWPSSGFHCHVRRYTLSSRAHKKKYLCARTYRREGNQSEKSFRT